MRPSTESSGETTAMPPTALPRTTDGPPASTTAPVGNTPRMVGQRYTLSEPVGSGGMGTVWRSRDELLRREVAIKEVIIPPGVPTRERELLCERMLREARAAAALNHPAVVSIFDVVNYNERPWIVMELLEASSITDIIRDEGPMPPIKVAEIGLAVLGALATAHQAGVLHRDVKPGNVLITQMGRVVLTDFGAARSPNDTPLTSTGLLLGSPQYIAPERARGRPFGPASDLFSLGSSLYAAVEGRPPFDRGEPLSTMTAVVCEPPDEMYRAGPLEPVLRGLLAKDPADRWDIERATNELKKLLDAGNENSVETSPAAAPPAQEPASTLPRPHVARGGAERSGTKRRPRPTAGVSDAGVRTSASVRRGARRHVSRQQPGRESTSEQTNSGNTSGRHRRVSISIAERRAAKRARKDEKRSSSWRHRERKSRARMWLTLLVVLMGMVGVAFVAHYLGAADLAATIGGAP